MVSQTEGYKSADMKVKFYSPDTLIDNKNWRYQR